VPDGRSELSAVTLDWFEKDELFREQLERGHGYATFVADYLRAAGLTVTVTPMAWRPTVEARHEFADEYDLVVGRTRRKIVDVKSRNLDFTGPADYPYGTAFVSLDGGRRRIDRQRSCSSRSERRQWPSCRSAPPVSGRASAVTTTSGTRPVDDLVAWLREKTD
jgi:hypothetical protein